MKKCSYANEVVSGVYICNMYGDYCLLDEPDLKQCEKIYGTVDDTIIKEAEFDEDYNTDEVKWLVLMVGDR